MRLGLIAVLCACVVAVTGDVAHLKAKARLLGRLKHKRGVLSAVPTFKLGHDIPLVSHSVVKPFVVTYPPTAAVAAFKVPLAHPLVQRYPVPVGHKVPVPHPHYGLKFPHHHHHPKTFVLPKPDQHFHHHHHHVAPRPAVPVIPTGPAVPVPVPATPVVPVAQPSGTIAHPIPAPTPPVFIQPTPFVPAQPVAPPPVHVLPPHHSHLSPVFPSVQAPVPLLPAPVYPVAPQYVIRPGNAIQTSLFATYPRYPLVNYQQLYPLTAPAAPTVGQVFLNRPQVPHFHVGHEVIQQPSPAVAVEPTPALLHPSPNLLLPTPNLLQPTPNLLQPTPTLLHPTQATIPQSSVHLHSTQSVPLDHNGWSPVPAQHDLASHIHPEGHLPQSPDPHYHSDSHHFTQEQGTQVFEHHTDEQQYHDYQHELQHHIQQQIDQAQFEQHLNNQHQLSQEYGVPQQLSQEYGHPDQEYSHHGQEYTQQGQEYAQQGQEYAQQGQEYAQQGQEYAQRTQAFAHQQLGQEYGHPQEVEGRSSEGEEDTQRYHNHIPLGLQPPINRPLEHFR